MGIVAIVSVPQSGIYLERQSQSILLHLKTKAKTHCHANSIPLTPPGVMEQIFNNIEVSLMTHRSLLIILSVWFYAFSF